MPNSQCSIQIVERWAFSLIFAINLMYHARCIPARPPAKVNALILCTLRSNVVIE
jgi:hypothetical protein